MTALIPMIVMAATLGPCDCSKYMPSNDLSCYPQCHVRVVNVPPLFARRPVYDGGPLPITRAVVRTAIGVPVRVVRNSAIRIHNINARAVENRRKYNDRAYN